MFISTTSLDEFDGLGEGDMKTKIPVHMYMYLGEKTFLIWRKRSVFFPLVLANFFTAHVGHEVPGVVAVLCKSIAGPHRPIAAKTQPAQSNKRKKQANIQPSLYSIIQT